MAKFDTFGDKFNDNVIDGAKWDPWGTNSSVGEANQQLEITLAVDPLTGYAGIASDNTYDLTASYVLIELKSLPSSGGNSESSFEVYVDSGNKISWFSAWGWLYANYTVSDSTTWHGEIAYNASTTKWLRIREASSTTYWDYSANGTSWTNLTSVSNPITVTALQIEIAAGNWEAEAAPGYFKLDNFNPDAVAGPAGVKKINELAIDSVKTINELAIGSVKTINNSAA